MTLSKSQLNQVGGARAAETAQAQLYARGQPSTETKEKAKTNPFMTWCREYLGNASLSAADWEKSAMQDFADGSFQCGNHICLPRVCWKGRWAKIKFCRMLYWHWKRVTNNKGVEVMKRMHGHLLQESWNGDGLPPVQACPPNPGMPLQEITHPFFFKLTPGIMLGPRCNHDLGIFLRLPVLTESQQKFLLKDFDSNDAHLSEVDKDIEKSCNNALLKITSCSTTGVVQASTSMPDIATASKWVVDNMDVNITWTGRSRVC